MTSCDPTDEASDDSETSCSLDSWTNWPAEMDNYDINDVAGEIYFQFKQARRRWRNYKSKLLRTRFGRFRATGRRRANNGKFGRSFFEGTCSGKGKHSGGKSPKGDDPTLGCYC